MKSFLLRPANLFLIGLLLSLVMMGSAYLESGMGRIVVPMSSSTGGAPKSLTLLNPGLFIEFIMPYVAGYWLMWIVVYFLLYRWRLMKLSNVSVLIHFFCIAAGVTVVVFVNNAPLPEFATTIELNLTGMNDARILNIAEDMIIDVRLASLWTKIGAIFIFLGMIIGIIGIRKAKHVA